MSQALSLVLVIATLFNRQILAGDDNHRVTCSDIKNNAAGWLAKQFSSDVTKNFVVEFYLSTNRNKQPVQIDRNEWSQLATNGFDVSKKTFIITHGYLSGGQRQWVLDLKDAILESRDGNVIMVDWSDGSNKKNYVNAAKNTMDTSSRIFNFLQTLRIKAQFMKGSSNEILYNHLHLIGHSLGAHICGQTAYLLKKDDFWKVDRVTGLDPAKPCFSNVGTNLRIDKEDAKFVDILHTQIGNGFTDALGLTETLGHIDFYINGGYVQPECQGKTFGYDEMICSHKLATRYFIESIRNAKTGSCTFPIQRWNGSYMDAQIRISFMKKGLNCNNCPKMGMDATNSTMNGIFLVLTSSQQPYCKFNPDRDLRNIIPGIRKLKGIKSIFDHSKPDNGPAYLPNL